MIIKSLQKRHGHVRVIPTNVEKFLSIKINRLQFLDSLQFTAGSSIERLAKTLNEDEFIYTKQHFQVEEEFQLIKKKGVFPYDFFDSYEKLKYDRLPSQKEFHNTLDDTDCSDDDYAHAKHVWDTFKCQTFEDYHDIYLKSDILLLTDIFEKFRHTSMQNYGLDAAHYYSAPGMSWEAALKMTKINLELLTDESMHSFLEKSIRGGISMISKRFAKANNPSSQNYDPTKLTSFLIYLDANNLYGWAMSQHMPVGDFTWLKEEEINHFHDNIKNILDLLDDDEYGYIFEVDLEYPTELHELHKDYPLASERIKIYKDLMSPFQKKRFPEYQLKQEHEKLTANLRDKKNYVVHYRNLKFYIQQGLKLTAIHNVLKFKQKSWVKEYIDYNTSCRSRAKSAFEKDFYKLMNNSAFGKTNENLRNRINVEIITDRKTALKRVAKPSFERSQIIRDDLVIIQNKVTSLLLDKPLYVGFTVLELSKLLMYEFHYEKMLQRYSKINLCFTDTDSLLYEVFTDDIYKDMLENVNDYDFSDYPFEHPLYNKKNKKVIGKFKDELNGIILEEFIGLRPKCYSLLFLGKVEDNIIKDYKLREKQKSKGIKEKVKLIHLRHSHYKKCLNDLDTISVNQNMIKSKKQTLSTYHIQMLALTAFDTKRWIYDDNINTRAHGHYTSLYDEFIDYVHTHCKELRL